MAIAISHKAFQGEKRIGLQQNLSFLRNTIKQKRISISSLSRRTGIPKATMRRFINGRTQRPNFQLIQDVSKCLNMDMNCLFAVSKKDAILDEATERELSSSKVPILEWNEIEQWISEGIDHKSLISKRWINTNHSLNPRSFALKSTAVTEPYIPINSAVIINPEGQIVDQKLILVVSDNLIEPSIYKAISYESGFYLKPLLEEGNTKRLIRLTPETSIVGILEEAVVFL
jgi:transcriptional regulator with XRE-family HTH domain